MKHGDDPVNLTSEARRRALSRDEAARLEALFEESPEERVLYGAGRAFDRDSSAREGDDVLVARLASRAAQRFGAPATRSRSRRRPLVALVAAAVVAASSAAAGSGVVYLMRADRYDGAASASEASGVRTSPEPARRSPPVAPRRASELAAPLAPSPLPEAAPAPAQPRVVPAPSRRAASDTLGAPALFGDANKKRLAGDTTGAVALYRELAERYPGSAEANLAELSLGKLFLASGQSERALAYFRRAGASGGALGSEALWGEAGALRALGRSADERAVLERLLAQYPSGAYAKAARKRLGTRTP